MSKLTAVFSLIDEMSGKMSAISESGIDALNKIDDAASAANNAFDSAATSAESAVSSIDNMSRSLGNYGGSLNAAQSTTNEYASKLEEMFGICEQAADNLCKSIEASADIHSDLANSAGASSKAMIELEAAQIRAQEAMNEYDRVIISGTEDLTELERAAEQAQHAADDLADANGKAAEEIEKMSDNAEDAGDNSEDAGEKGVNAAETISTALATLGITDKLKDITKAVWEMSEAFSEAESTVVKATGATGGALDGLEDSMMSAYSAARNADLDATAGAIGEINTRLGYTGDQLTETTNKFLDFSSATGGDAVSDVRTVTQLMNQWNVSGKDLNLTLDKLTYAGQVSGISVSGLSSQLTTNKAILDDLGFSLDESIALFSQFELKGTNTSAVMMGFRTAVANGTITSLEELYEVFDKIDSGLLSTADAADIFGTRAGPAIANAVKDGSFAIDDLVGSLENAQGTLDKTAEASQTMEQKMNQAQNSLKAVFTDAVQPATEGINSAVAELLGGAAQFLSENPNVTKAIVAVATALGVVVVGITGVTFATKVAIPALKSLGAAMAGSLGPMGLIVIGVTALVAAGAALVAMSKKEETEFDKLTESSKDQSLELDRMNAEYEETCAKFGETSDEAREMKYDLDKATESFENNKKTISELYSEIDTLVEKSQNTVTAYRDSTKEIDEQQENSAVLIAKLRELSSTSEKTAGSQIEMESIVARLNTDFPELGMSIEDVNGNLDAMADKLDKLSGAESRQAKFESAQKNLSELELEREQLEKAVEEAARVRLAAGDKFSSIVGDNAFTAFAGLFNGAKDAEKAYDEAREKETEAQRQLNEVNAAIADCTATIEEYGDIVSGTSDTVVTAYDAISIATSNVAEKTQELIEKYNEAYTAAQDSVSGQYSIWDNAERVIPTSIYSINSALDSQINYWDNYNSNLETLLGKADSIDGLQDVLASFSDGSAESVNAVAGMATATDDELKKMVESYKALKEQQDKTAESLADTRVDFEKELDGITSDMEAAIEKMNLDADAKDAATKTIEAYADAIRATKGKAVDAASEVASAAKSALNMSYTLTENATEGKPVDGYASGTMSAEPGLALVGEEGPELINFGGGEIVYPTDKTAAILDGIISEKQYNAAVPSYEDIRQTAGGYEKKITLELVGQGAISVDKGTDKNAVLDIIQANLRPVLLQLIQDEIYEEGAGTYDY